MTLLLGFLAVSGLSGGVLAADAPQGDCLSKAEQRAAVGANRAIPLAKAIKSVRERGHHADLVRASLCRQNESLIYVLTLLGRSGKVIRLSVDAGSGELVNGRQ
jgi:uncharacterized membrane protein YkoI